MAPVALVALAWMTGCAGSAGAPESEVERNEFALTPADPAFGLQWALRNTGQVISAPNGNPPTQTGARGVDINATRAWDLTQGSSSVIVALIDELPVQVDHEDLRDRIFVNTGEVPNDGIDNDGNGYVDDYRGYDFAQTGAVGNHGTLIAGIIAATANNGKGGSGVAPNVRILPIAAHIGFPAEMVAAIQYARSMGAKIVNLSQGNATFDSSIYSAIQSSGMLFTISAGNRGTAAYGYPASYDLANILSVANLENMGRLQTTSNYGEAHVDLAAPGWNIYGPFALDANNVPSTSSYGYLSGTSFAAPHVAGVAALLMSQNPAWSIAQVTSRILSTTSSAPSLAGMVKSGGVLDAYAALAGVSAIDVTSAPAAARITLSWSSQSGASRYDVEVDGAVIANGLSTSYAHTGLARDSVHVYRVRAVNGGTPGLWSKRIIQAASPPPIRASVSVGSAHNYSNNTSKDFYVSAKNAISIRVHFSRIDIAPTPGDEHNDCLFYYPNGQEGVDTCGNPAYILRSSYPTGFWTRFTRVPFRVHLETDAALTAWGFQIDRIEYFTGIPPKPSEPWAFPVSATVIRVGHSPASGAEKTNLYRSTSLDGSYSKIATLTVNSSGQAPDYDDTGRTTGTTYYYKISSTNGLGESPLSEATSATP